MVEKKKGKRSYTLSEKALLQRQEAARTPRKTLGGNINALKHGRYSEKNLGTMPLDVCPGCLFFEIIKGNYEIIVLKKKGTL